MIVNLLRAQSDWELTTPPIYFLQAAGSKHSNTHIYIEFGAGCQIVNNILLECCGPLPRGVVHGEVNHGVDGVDDEGDDAEAEAGGGPLPGVLRHVGQGPAQAH